MQWIYAACLILDREGVDPKRVHIENNSLQNPHYEQVIVPLIQEHFRKTKYRIPIRPDNRKKPSKFERIEGTLEPIWRNGNLIFNIRERENPHMMRMEEEMLGVSENAKDLDGPDMLEGGTWIILNRALKEDLPYAFGTINNRRF